MKSEARTYSSPLRQQQTEDTRQRIVQAALEQIAEQPDEAFSHEQIAQRAGIALRTVYRHFPARPELLDAVWKESDRRLNLQHYPDTEEQMLASLEPVYGEMDRNAALIRGLLNSNAGREMRRRDNERRRQGVVQALGPATQHLGAEQKKRVVAVFQALYGGRTWEMMRDRGQLAEGETAQAIDWAMRTLLDGLYRQQSRAKKNGSFAPNNGEAATRATEKNSKTKKEK